jgi:hypothetical protein
MVEGAPFRTRIDLFLLQDQPTVVTHKFGPIRTLDEIVGATLRTFPNPLFGFLGLGLALPLAGGPCHRTFIVASSPALNPLPQSRPASEDKNTETAERASETSVQEHHLRQDDTTRYMHGEE